MDTQKKLKVILSGGGTGGHIYPAVAVADALRNILGNGVEILFVGAEGKMEMEKIPALGYRIEGLPVAGLQRSFSASNLALPAKIARSMRKARRIIKDFSADIVAGFGGYASAPVLWSAQRMGIPTIIQEQNSYAGMTNKILSRRARRICVAYDGMDRFFRQEKIFFSGNPLRGTFSRLDSKRTEALEYFGFDSAKPVILILGGSLGTRTLNNMMKASVSGLIEEGSVQVIWQNGKLYDLEMEGFMSGKESTLIWRSAFIERMDLAYAAADVVISRSGAITVSELCLIGKPVVFVPSPNVSEDHQTKNARALVDKGAAVMVADADAAHEAIPVAMQILSDPERAGELSRNIKSLAIEDSAKQIAELIIKTAGEN